MLKPAADTGYLVAMLKMSYKTYITNILETLIVTNILFLMFFSNKEYEKINPKINRVKTSLVNFNTAR
jgi:hypothetical protein